VSRFVGILLAAGLWAGTAAAEDRKPPSPAPPEKAPERAPARAGGPELSAEDREVVENLELLESLDEAEDLELLLELSQEAD
jgi:hypothetical protein